MNVETLDINVEKIKPFSLDRKEINYFKIIGKNFKEKVTCAKIIGTNNITYQNKTLKQALDIIKANKKQACLLEKNDNYYILENDEGIIPYMQETKVEALVFHYPKNKLVITVTYLLNMLYAKSFKCINKSKTKDQFKLQITYNNIAKTINSEEEYIKFFEDIFKLKNTTDENEIYRILETLMLYYYQLKINKKEELVKFQDLFKDIDKLCPLFIESRRYCQDEKTFEEVDPKNLTYENLIQVFNKQNLKLRRKDKEKKVKEIKLEINEVTDQISDKTKEKNFLEENIKLSKLKLDELNTKEKILNNYDEYENCVNIKSKYDKLKSKLTREKKEIKSDFDDYQNMMDNLIIEKNKIENQNPILQKIFGVKKLENIESELVYLEEKKDELQRHITKLNLGISDYNDKIANKIDEFFNKIDIQNIKLSDYKKQYDKFIKEEEKINKEEIEDYITRAQLKIKKLDIEGREKELQRLKKKYNEYIR